MQELWTNSIIKKDITDGIIINKIASAKKIQPYHAKESLIKPGIPDIMEFKN